MFLRLLWVCLFCLAAPCFGNSPQTVWGRIHLEPPAMEVQVPIPALEGKVVQEGDIEDVIDALLKSLGQEGYPFARIVVREMDLVDGAVQVTLNVEPGSHAHLGKVVLRGAKITRDTVAWKLSGLHPGQVFTGMETETLVKSLRSSGFFLSVGEAALRPGIQDGAVVIEVPVKEPPYTRFAGVLGLAGEKASLSGLIDLKLRNIAGTGREARVGWQDQGRGITRFQLAYHEPWLPLVPIGIQGSLSHEVRETSYSFTRWDLAGVLKTGLHWQLTGGWGGSRSVEVDTANAREAYTRLGIQLDLRDQALNPGSGVLVAIESRTGTKTWGGKSHHRVRWNLSNETYFPAGRRWLIALKTHGMYLDTPERPIAGYDLIPVGGANSLRGYQEEQFLTHLGAIWQSEWRRLLDSRGSALYGFMDGGWVASAEGQLSNRLDTFLLGYGVGVRQAVAVGIIAVEYGIPRGRTLSSGRIHLRLTADF